VALHAITSESGGDAEVKKRLVERNTALPYPVHSDPEHKLLLPSKDGSNSLYLKKQKNASEYGGTYTDYEMVQPALVVVTKTGTVQQVWSWNTPPLDAVEPKGEMTPVASHGGKLLVGVRPTTSDLGPSIKANRNVSTSGKSIPTIMIEKLGLPTVVAAASGLVAVVAVAIYAIRKQV